MHRSKNNLPALLLMLMAICSINSRAIGQTPAKPSGAQPAMQQEEEVKYTEEEWKALDDAAKEQNYDKRGTMLLEFIGKWPKSELLGNVKDAYVTVLLGACDKEEKWDLLRSLAEKWRALHPNDKEILKVIAKASYKAEDYEKCGECFEELYKTEPTGPYALAILENYVKANNLAKQIDWTDRILKMPGLEGEFGLSWDLVKKYSASDNLPKMAEWCKKTLIAADAVKKLDKETQEQLKETRNACHLIVGRSRYTEDNFAEAEKEYRQALKYKTSCDAYFHIGMCLWKKPDVENAMVYLAAAELVGADTCKATAKKGLEDLYKSQHNQNIDSIYKEYRKAREQLLDK
jgi:tetratricopeptide (TPR) repeat protein